MPDLLGQAAFRWQLDLSGYHDAGHASVLVVGKSAGGERLVVKAWYDHIRFARETAALALWGNGPVARLVATASDLSVAAIGLIGGRPGGCPPNGNENLMVARAISTLHSTQGQPAGLPSLACYLHDEVMPRIRWRLARFGQDIPEWCMAALEQLELDSRRSVLLHGDLYRENVPFDEHGRPVFIDPLPMIGTEFFDWAFWIIYYTPNGRLDRLSITVKALGVDATELLPWCLLLCVDGLLYYRETGDPRTPSLLRAIYALGGAGPAHPGPGPHRSVRGQWARLVGTAGAVTDEGARRSTTQEDLRSDA